jgi:hypothetical protein
MADDIDRAQQEEEFFLARAINNVPRADLQARGRCLFCEEKVAEGVRFCSSECRDDFDRLHAAQNRNGRA